jgi:hypothetical protein
MRHNWASNFWKQWRRTDDSTGDETVAEERPIDQPETGDLAEKGDTKASTQTRRVRRVVSIDRVVVDVVS